MIFNLNKKNIKKRWKFLEKSLFNKKMTLHLHSLLKNKRGKLLKKVFWSIGKADIQRDEKYFHQNEKIFEKIFGNKKNGCIFAIPKK